MVLRFLCSSGQRPGLPLEHSVSGGGAGGQTAHDPERRLDVGLAISTAYLEIWRYNFLITFFLDASESGQCVSVSTHPWLVGYTPETVIP